MRFLSSYSLLFVIPEETEHPTAQLATALHLLFSPDANLQDPLQFFPRLGPLGSVARTVRREVVPDIARASTACWEHMVSLPI